MKMQGRVLLVGIAILMILGGGCIERVTKPKPTTGPEATLVPTTAVPTTTPQ